MVVCPSGAISLDVILPLMYVRLRRGGMGLGGECLQNCAEVWSVRYCIWSARSDFIYLCKGTENLCLQLRYASTCIYRVIYRIHSKELVTLDLTIFKV